MIRADGRPASNMTGLLIGCITNIILDPIFIFVCKWGVAGAAWATIIGQFLNAVYFVYCMFKFETIKLTKKDFVLQGKVIERISALDLSSFITQFATVVVLTVLNNALVKYGAQSIYGADIPMAVVGVVVKVSMLVMGIILGIAAGVHPILGYN